jgi:hypothetical protein
VTTATSGEDVELVERGEAHSLLGDSWRVCLAIAEYKYGGLAWKSKRDLHDGFEAVQVGRHGLHDKASHRDVVRVLAHKLIVMMVFEMMWYGDCEVAAS